MRRCTRMCLSGARVSLVWARVPSAANSKVRWWRWPPPWILERAGRRQLEPLSGVHTAAHAGGIFLGRQAFGLPDRAALPSLDRYAKVDLGTHQKLVGYVEASRGCAHRCLHCRSRRSTRGGCVLCSRTRCSDDVAQLVQMGAEHITFGDPDFFNGIRHSLQIVEALHAAFPALTYDATIKVEHLLEHREHLPTLARTGCLFIVSAVEAVHDDVLAHLQKGRAQG